MKEGTKVKVIDNQSCHWFEIGEVVERRKAPADDEGSVGFHSESNGLWYMQEGDYVIIDHDHEHAIRLMGEAMNAAINVGFSREVWEGIAAAIKQAEKEL